MKRRLQNIISRGIPAFVMIALLLIWQFVSTNGWIPKYMLPSPYDVIVAFKGDFALLMSHAKYTVEESVIGLACGIVFGAVIAVLMDRWKLVYRAMYPLIVISQTIPTIAIAPLLVLWLGYEMKPKIVLIVITTFFPIAVNLFNGLQQSDADEMKLMQAMGASRLQIFHYIKLPQSLPHFFAGLRVSAAYAIVGAVISEWLGGYYGLGVYMVRVKKSYNFDKMFAVIFLISLISLLLMWLVDILQKVCMPWERVILSEQKKQKAE